MPQLLKVSSQWCSWLHQSVDSPQNIFQTSQASQTNSSFGSISFSAKNNLAIYLQAILNPLFTTPNQLEILVKSTQRRSYRIRSNKGSIKLYPMRVLSDRIR